jgi:hypothetical protein
MRNARDAEQKKSSYIFPIVVGLFSPLLATAFIRLSGEFEDWYFLIIGLIYFFAAVALAYRSAKLSRAKVVIIYLMLPLGSFLDSVVDHLIYSSGRNLWGLEIIVLLALAPLPLFIGTVAGRILRKRSSKRASS